MRKARQRVVYEGRMRYGRSETLAHGEDQHVRKQAGTISANTHKDDSSDMLTARAFKKHSKSMESRCVDTQIATNRYPGVDHPKQGDSVPGCGDCFNLSMKM